MFNLSSVHGAERTWSGGGGDDNWSTSGNWNSLPDTDGTDGLLFGGETRLAPVNDFAAGAEFTRILFQAGAGEFVLSGNAIALNTFNGIINESTVEQTVDLDIEILSASIALYPNAGDLTINGKLSGTGAVTTNAAHWLSLNGENTHSGGTVLAAGGHLRLGHAKATGTGLFTVTGTDLEFATGIGTFYAGTFGGSAAVTLTDTNGQAVFLEINGIGAASKGGAISGLGGLIINMGAGGKQTLTTANTYTGGTIIESGTLELGSGGGNISSSGALTINGGALEIQRSNSSKTVTVSSLNGTGGEIIGNTGTAASIFRVNTTGNDSWDGSFKDGNATLVFDKQGSGSLTLGGSSFHTGATTVTAGKLIINGALTNTASVTVANGATLGGQGGIINSAVILQNTGGMQFSLEDENEINLTLTSLAIGANSDLSLSLGTDAVAGTQFTLISGSYTGEFATLNGGAFNPNSFQLTYNSFVYDLELVYGSNEIYVNVAQGIPEPGASLLLLSGVAILFTRKRRKN